MDKINLGEPQPKPCPECKNTYGYQVSDNIRLSYTYFYDGEGASDGGKYSDYVQTSKVGKRAYCRDCGADLKLLIERDDL
jgi:hypothetical protein